MDCFARILSDVRKYLAESGGKVDSLTMYYQRGSKAERHVNPFLCLLHFGEYKIALMLVSQLLFLATIRFSMV